MKYLIITLLSFLLLTSCESKNEKLQKEYEELASLYPSKFANGNSTVIYNVNKEYMIIASWSSSEGFGLSLMDLSKLDLEQKVRELRGHRISNIGSGAQYEWLNAYVHELIDNYNKYGETFLLVQPFD